MAHGHDVQCSGTCAGLKVSSATSKMYRSKFNCLKGNREVADDERSENVQMKDLWHDYLEMIYTETTTRLSVCRKL